MEGIVNEIKAVLPIEQASRDAIVEIKSNKQKIKELSAKYKIILGSDPAYREADNNAKLSLKEKTRAKAEAHKSNPELIKIKNDLKLIRAEMKNEQLSLMDYLVSYNKQTACNEIDDGEGGVIPFEIVAKLKKTV
jgi:hypothetical protein